MVQTIIVMTNLTTLEVGLFFVALYTQKPMMIDIASNGRSKINANILSPRDRNNAVLQIDVCRICNHHKSANRSA